MAPTYSNGQEMVSIYLIKIKITTKFFKFIKLMYKKAFALVIFASYCLQAVEVQFIYLFYFSFVHRVQQLFKKRNTKKHKNMYTVIYTRKYADQSVHK